MNKFNITSKCTKCGEHSASCVYTVYRVYKEDDYNKEGLTKDLIQRTCRTCGFSWKEACLDSDDNEKTEER